MDRNVAYIWRREWNSFSLTPSWDDEDDKKEKGRRWVWWTWRRYSRWMQSHLLWSSDQSICTRRPVCAGAERHTASLTQQETPALSYGAEPKVEQDHNVYECVCACVHVRICVCARVVLCVCARVNAWNPGFSPLGTCTNTLPIFPLSFTFKGSTRSAVNHPLSQSRPFVLSLFIDQGRFKRMYVVWLEFLPWLILIL